jgi:hypothetical protein
MLVCGEVDEPKRISPAEGIGARAENVNAGARLHKLEADKVDGVEMSEVDKLDGVEMFEVDIHEERDTSSTELSLSEELALSSSSG